MNFIATPEPLEALYQPAPTLASTAKELDRLIPEYQRYIELSPFVAIATVGPDGMDCSPRGSARRRAPSTARRMTPSAWGGRRSRCGERMKKAVA